MPLNGNALCGLEELKLFLNIPSSETAYDDVLEALINMASDVIEQHVGTPILTGGYDEVLDGDGTNVLIPRHYPIVEVTSIEIDGESLAEDDYYVYDTYIYSDIVFPAGNKNVELEYSAGWGDDMDSVPGTFKLACLKLAAYWYRRDVGAYSNAFGEPEEARLPSWSMPAAVRALLDPYTEVRH